MRSLITQFGCLPANQPDSAEWNQSVTADHVAFILQSFTQGCSDGLIAIVSLINCNARLKLKEKKSSPEFAIWRFGCQAYGICLVFKDWRSAVLVIEKANAKQGGDDGWTEKRIETCDLVSAVCVLMFLFSHTAALCCTLIQLTVDTRIHTHQHKHKLACRDTHTQAHKELCATGGVGVIVSYRWWQRGHMPIYFWGFWHCN